jgi:hypothetical protein
MSILRYLEEADYQPIIEVVDDWWGGRPVAVLLQKLFFVHFRPTSFREGESFEQVLALSQSNHHPPCKGISTIAGGPAPLTLWHRSGLSHRDSL